MQNINGRWKRVEKNKGRVHLVNYNPFAPHEFSCSSKQSTLCVLRFELPSDTSLGEYVHILLGDDQFTEEPAPAFLQAEIYDKHHRRRK